MEDLSIINASEIITLSPGYLRKGNQMEELGIIKGGNLSIKNGKISSVGSPRYSKKEIDANGKVVMPGFIDCHTHLVFAGERAGEFEARIRGKTYQEIANEGGGIVSTVKATREATQAELFDTALKRLNYALSHGTTTMEVKSGYGLSTKDELKILKVINLLSEKHPITVVPTFLGAHSVPPEKSKEKYIEELINEGIPKASKVAKFCDVFCEKGVFTREETKKILTRGKEFGLVPKVHADELSSSGGSEIAGEVSAISADHVVYPSDEGIKKLKESGTIVVLLPGACFYLSHKPPIEKFMTKKIPIALGSDFNPGSSPILSMPIIMGLACLLLKLTPSQVITASTINAAYAIGVAEKVGSIEVDKDADIIILNINSYTQIPYWFGFNPVEMVIKKGRIVFNSTYR
jgi:imidazolonepropionase